MRRAAVLAVASVLLAARPASGGEVRSVFLVSKSENRNQVHYAVRVDEACQPVGDAPVRPYWKMLERGPSVTEPLLPREQRAYGIARQRVAGGQIELALRALPSRWITVTTGRAASGACAATAYVAINGRRSRLFDVHLSLAAFGVDHVLLTGWAPNGMVVRERIDR